MTRFIVLVSASLMMALLGACSEDSGPTANRGCVDDPSICPEGTRCQLDAVGQGYCQSIEEPSPDGTPRPQNDMNTGGTPAAVPDMMLSNGGANGGGAAGGEGGSTGMGGTAGQPESTPDMGGITPGECPELNLLLKPAAGSVARVMLVVDRSYSMIQSEDRWTPLTNALQTVMENLGGGVQFGLTLFPNPWHAPSEDARCAAGVVNVDVDFDTQAEILQTMDTGRPVSNRGTPTASAVAAAGRFFIENPSPNDYILLATDGGPGCNLYENEPTRYSNCVCLSNTCTENLNCLDDDRTVQVVQGLYQEGIETMVLGITIGLPRETEGCYGHYACGAGQACSCVDNGGCGPSNVGTCEDILRPTLSRLAVAGGRDNNGSYFEVTNLDELAASVQAVAGSIRPCSFDLEALGDFGNDLQLTIDGMVIPNDPDRQNGWYAEEGVLTLYGSACAAIRDGRAHTISAQCLQ